MSCLFAKTVTEAADKVCQQFSSREAPLASFAALKRKLQLNLLVAIGNREHVGAEPVYTSFTQFHFRDYVGRGITCGMS